MAGQPGTTAGTGHLTSPHLTSPHLTSPHLCRYRNHPIFKCSAKLNVTNNAEVTDLKDNWVVTV